MSDFIRCLVGMFAVIAPLGALASLLASDAVGKGLRPGLRLAAGTPLAAFLVLSLGALVNGPLLDWLNISPESFQFAAGAAMAPLAVRLVLTGDSMPPARPLPAYGWLIPLAVPLLAGPSSIIAVISYAARFGIGEAVAATALVCALTAALFTVVQRPERAPLPVVQTLARLSGGLLALIAIELVIDGVHSV